MKVCAICGKAKEDCTDYIIEDVPNKHTFWNFYSCIACRDKFLEYLQSLLDSKKEK